MKNFLMKAEYVGNKGFLEKIALGDIFEHLSVYEDKFDKDYTEFSFEQAEQFVEDYTAKTKTSKKLVKEALSKYCAWYREQKMYSGGIEVDIEGECTETKPDKTGEENIEANLEKIEEQESETGKNLKKTSNTQFNPDRYISEEELNEYCERLESPFDKLLLRSIYEGFDFVEEIQDIINLKLEDCDIENKTIKYPISGKEVKVSDELMKLLIECGKININFTKSNQSVLGNKIIAKLTEKDENRCFKMFFNEDDNETLIQSVKSRVYKIKKELAIEKITTSNLCCSGFLTESIKLGLTSGFEIMKKFDTCERKKLLDRYKMIELLPQNYKRKINVYLKEAE